MELLKKYNLSITSKDSEFKSEKITSSGKAYEIIKQFYFDDIDIYESFFLLLLDVSLNTKGYVKISQGGTAGTVVDVKIIAKYAIDTLASGVILAHNHPSGNLKASEPDKKITAKIKDALKVFDINVLDHIILSSSGYFSFMDEGLL